MTDAEAIAALSRGRATEWHLDRLTFAMVYRYVGRSVFWAVEHEHTRDGRLHGIEFCGKGGRQPMYWSRTGQPTHGLRLMASAEGRPELDLWLELMRLGEC